MENITLTAIDLAKQSFAVVSVNHQGRVVKKKSVSRYSLLEYIRSLPRRSTIAMEACTGSNYWGRTFRELGFEVRLIPAQHVTAYRRNQKNDANDAEAIAEAARRPNIHFVPVKSTTQQDILLIHKQREVAVRTRTALVNQVHGTLLDYGAALPKGRLALKKAVGKLLEDPEALTEVAKDFINEQLHAIALQEQRVSKFDKQLKLISTTHPICKKLMEVPGIGVITSTALVASITNPEGFKNGRNLAASLGLVPRQHSTGGRAVLGSITKHGDCYLRKLLVHGARTVARTAKKNTHSIHLWIEALKQRKPVNVAIVALANKLARIAWCLMARDTEYQAHHLPA